ncbi:MAG: hypothetical protein JNJ41_13470 [Bacteroidia bacterium]|nr:hypothetical protein [Bacteroidia bacterium]
MLRKMKKKIILCLVAAATLSAKPGIKTNVSEVVGFSASFQTHSVDDKVNKMNEVVGLTDSQKIKYKALVEKSEKEKKELQEKVKTATSQEKEKLQNDFKRNYEVELKKILTPEQFKKLEDKKSKNK